jgi:hypothetical protein
MGKVFYIKKKIRMPVYILYGMCWFEKGVWKFLSIMLITMKQRNIWNKIDHSPFWNLFIDIPALWSMHQPSGLITEESLQHRLWRLYGEGHKTQAHSNLCDLVLHDPKWIKLLMYTSLPYTAETLEILFIWEYWPIQPFQYFQTWCSKLATTNGTFWNYIS